MGLPARSNRDLHSQPPARRFQKHPGPAGDPEGMLSEEALLRDDGIPYSTIVYDLKRREFRQFLGRCDRVG